MAPSNSEGDALRDKAYSDSMVGFGQRFANRMGNLFGDTAEQASLARSDIQQAWTRWYYAGGWAAEDGAKSEAMERFIEQAVENQLRGEGEFEPTEAIPSTVDHWRSTAYPIPGPVWVELSEWVGGATEDPSPNLIHWLQSFGVITDNWESVQTFYQIQLEHQRNNR